MALHFCVLACGDQGRNPDTACMDDGARAQPKEPLLHQLISGLFHEMGTVPPGSIIDAGANTGEEACLLAVLGKDRVVHAIDPLSINVQHIRRRYAAHRLLQPVLGGLGDKTGTLSVPSSYNAQTNVTAGSAQISWSYRKTRREVKVVHGVKARPLDRNSVPLYTIDTLFHQQWMGERLGFAHLDMEGMELAALRGAESILARDRPVLTVEVWTHTKAAATRAKLAHLAQLNYDT